MQWVTYTPNFIWIGLAGFCYAGLGLAPRRLGLAPRRFGIDGDDGTQSTL
jgi:hypothetical protein